MIRCLQRNEARPSPGFLLCALLLALAAARAGAAPLALLRAPGPGDSLLVVAPHPDDETLCCAGIIQRALAAGASVTVVWVTGGDAFEIDAVIVERTLRPKGANLLRLARRRIGEAHAAAGLLGIAGQRQILLGYPDRGLNQLLGAGHSSPYRSRYTHALAVPYPDALAPGSSYVAANLARDLDAVIDAAAPTLVLAPSAADRHGDHAAVAELVRRAMTRRGEGGRILGFLVHAGPRWPRPRGLHRALPLAPPPALRGREWLRFELTPAEIETKLDALEAHASQMRVMRGFLLGFVRADEIFERDSSAPDSAAPDAGLDQDRAH